MESMNRATDLLTDPTVLTVSVPEGAEILGISRSTAVRHSQATGEICAGVPVIRIGKRAVRVSTAALRNALGVPHPNPERNT